MRQAALLHEIVRQACAIGLPEMQRHTQDVPFLRRLMAEDVGARAFVMKVIRRGVSHTHELQDDDWLVSAAVFAQQCRVNSCWQAGKGRGGGLGVYHDG